MTLLSTIWINLVPNYERGGGKMEKNWLKVQYLMFFICWFNGVKWVLRPVHEMEGWCWVQGARIWHELIWHKICIPLHLIMIYEVLVSFLLVQRWSRPNYLSFKTKFNSQGAKFNFLAAIVNLKFEVDICINVKLDLR